MARKHPTSASPRASPGRTLGPGASAASQPLDEGDIEALQNELDRVPPPFEPLDVSMVDGYLCGVLLQPQAVDAAQWLRHITDADGRPLPPCSVDVVRLRTLVFRRHAELQAAIDHRQWFDPWVFELAADEMDADTDVADDATAASQAVYSWVAGFATAQTFFPGLMGLDAAALNEPLALIYRHLDAEDLEDADELIDEIATLEPPRDLASAVEELVRATLLLADVSQPKPAPAAASRPTPRPPTKPVPRRR
jgi:uncharacterized protein